MRWAVVARNISSFVGLAHPGLFAGATSGPVVSAASLPGCRLLLNLFGCEIPGFTQQAILSVEQVAFPLFFLSQVLTKQPPRLPSGHLAAAAAAQGAVVLAGEGLPGRPGVPHR